MGTQSRRRKSGIGRAATTVVPVCGLIFGSAGPGAAYGFKDGYKWRSSCTIQSSDPWLHVAASGTVDILASGKSTVTQRSGTYGFCRNP